MSLLVEIAKKELPDLSGEFSRALYCEAADPKSITGEAVVLIPYLRKNDDGFPLYPMQLLVGRTAMVNTIRFNKQGLVEYGQAHSFWKKEQVALTPEALPDTIRNARLVSDEINASFVVYRDAVSEEEIPTVAEQITYWHGRQHHHASYHRLDALAERIPEFVKLSYDPSTKKGMKRRLKGIERTLFAVDIPGELASRLAAIKGSEVVLLKESTGFTMSAEGIEQCVLSYRMIRSVTPVKGLPANEILSLRTCSENE